MLLICVVIRTSGGINLYPSRPGFLFYLSNPGSLCPILSTYTSIGSGTNNGSMSQIVDAARYNKILLVSYPKDKLGKSLVRTHDHFPRLYDYLL